VKIFIFIILLIVPIISEDFIIYKEPDNLKLRKILAADNKNEKLNQLSALYSANNNDQEFHYFLILEYIEQNLMDSLYDNLTYIVKNKKSSLAFSSINGFFFLINQEYKLNSIYKHIKEFSNSLEPQYQPYYDFLKAVLLYKKNMNRAAYQLIEQNEDFYLKNPLYSFFYLGGKIAYEAENYHNAIRLLGKAYQINAGSGIYTLLELSALKANLSKKETQELFTSLANSKLEKAPDFILPELGKNNLQLSNEKGKFVLLVFWASWCGPCRKELPLIQNLYLELKDKLTIWAINIEGDSLKAFNTKNQLNLQFPILIDDGFVQSNYAVTSIPRSILINPNQEIILKIIGSSDNIGEIIKNRMKYFE